MKASPVTQMVRPSRFTAMLAAVALIGGGVAGAALITTPAAAQLAQAKAVVDAAKARGEVGEQADGFLGVVGGAAGGVAAAVAEINAGRADAYKEAAAKTGVTAAAAGQAAAQQLFARMPAGQFYKPAGGAWTRK